MKKIQYNYEQYYDKILGCFMGKCVCGTMGAPYEGMKQILNLEYDKSMIQKALPNDDLDIQLLWLEVLEKYGENFSSIDLAHAFYQGYPHCPGEYAYFKKNCDRKIYPPASGSFHNDFYQNGMGSPIRSEIWACVNPLSPKNAVRMAKLDGSLDHKFDSIVAEGYLAALQAIAFAESDIYILLEKSREYLSESTKLEQLYRDIYDYYQKGYDIFEMRELIIREYGHPDCTNLYQNMGIIWSSLLHGNGDIIQTTMLAINCGFDTDCTAATVGAILGLLLGGKKLQEIFEVSEIYYIAEALVDRKDNKITTLAFDIARVGCYFSKNNLLDIEITQIVSEYIQPIARNYIYEIQYSGQPILQKENKISIFVKNVSGNRKKCHISAERKNGYRILHPSDVTIQPGETIEVPVAVISQEESILSDNETEVFTIHVSDDVEELKICFGLCQGIRYQVYGPFWENVVTIPRLKSDESYYKYLGDNDEIREYHLNMTCDFGKEYIPEGDYLKQKNFKGFYKDVILTNSRFCVSDLFGFEGPCVAYMSRTITCKENMNCMLYVGKSDKIKIWLNNNLILHDEKYEYCSCENKHIFPVHLTKGQNQLLIKIARSSHEAVFSLLFIEEGDVMSFPKQLLL